MYDLSLTPEAESVYSERAALYGQTLDIFLNQTLPQQMRADDAYKPTPEEWGLIHEGLSQLDAGLGVLHADVWKQVRRAAGVI